MTKRRIWFDQDSVIYNLSSVWYDLHNRDYPEHELCIEHVDGWNTAEQCKKNNCPADIYDYFNYPEVWTDGGIIEGAYNVIHKLHEDDVADIGILTTAANAMSMPYKVEWLNKHFPFIEDIIIVNGHLKHLIRGDILIDDGIHNLTKWEGIGILYSQPWNLTAARLRAYANNDVAQWVEVDRIVRKSLSLLNQGFSHKVAEAIIASQQT